MTTKHETPAQAQHRIETANELQRIARQLRDLIDEARGVLRDGERQGVVDYEHERRTWLASLEMALDHEHEWLGGRYDHTLQDTVDALRSPERDEEDDQ